MLKYLLIVVALLATGACSADEKAAAAAAPEKQWQAGQDYFVLETPQPTSTGDKIEVLEVFSYACPHCAHFQPYAEELKSKLPANAQFVLLPAVFQAPWEPFARAFYTAKSLGLLDKTHQALFDAIHRDRLPLQGTTHRSGDPNPGAGRASGPRVCDQVPRSVGPRTLAVGRGGVHGRRRTARLEGVAR